jgi:aspartate/methionine/tyrosine aminotransferase
VLEAGYAAALTAAHKPRILLLLNPNNPLGTVYSEAELTLAIEFCEAQRMHLVVDEIYANSTHGCASRWLKAASRPTAGGDTATGFASEGDAGEPRFVSIVEVMHKRGTAGGSGVGATSSVADAAVTGGPAAGAGGSELQSRGRALVPPEGGSAACTPKEDNAPCGTDGSAHAALSAKAHAAPQLASYMGNYVHVLWGLSKDWAMSGYRVGVLHSHNAALLKALGNINYFTGVSSDTQDRLAAVLTDTQWCKRYLAANCGALRAAYALVTGILADARIPFVPACSGMFVWIDLRRFLRHHRTAAPAALAASGTSRHRDTAASEPDWEAERALTTLMFDKAKVLLTPGEACMAAEPGFYRCCFAWMPQLESVRVGFVRLQKLLQELGPAPDSVGEAP